LNKKLKKGVVMKKFTWILKQLFPCLYYSEYVITNNNQKELAIWRMWFGRSYDIKRWTLA
jgi:hypothetical protein